MDTAYLCFRIHEHRYAIENRSILRLLSNIALFPLPIDEKGIRGLTMMEDQLIAILDLEEWLWGKQSEHAPLTIFLEAGTHTFGICAEEIEGIKRIDEHEWIENERTDLPFYYKQEDESIFLIDLLQLQGR